MSLYLSLYFNELNIFIFKWVYILIWVFVKLILTVLLLLLKYFKLHIITLGSLLIYVYTYIGASVWSRIFLCAKDRKSVVFSENYSTVFSIIWNAAYIRYYSLGTLNQTFKIWIQWLSKLNCQCLPTWNSIVVALWNRLLYALCGDKIGQVICCFRFDIL